jgi:hypothetical protein
LKHTPVYLPTRITHEQVRIFRAKTPLPQALVQRYGDDGKKHVMAIANIRQPIQIRHWEQLIYAGPTGYE